MSAREKVESRLRVGRRRTSRRKLKQAHSTFNLVRESGLPLLDYGELDLAIRPLVHRLRQEGFETTASCQGGEGHSFKVPTVIIKYRKKRSYHLKIVKFMQFLEIPCTVSLCYMIQKNRIMYDESHFKIELWEQLE